MATDFDLATKTAIAEEVRILDLLQAGIRDKLKEATRGNASGLPGLAAVTDAVTKGYTEIAHRLYGRAVCGHELDEDEKPKCAFSYRISQANVGYIDGDCKILARNSPMASALVTTRPGDIEEIELKAKSVLLSVSETRDFDGSIGFLSGKDADFSAMEVDAIGATKTKVIGCLRNLFSGLPAVVPGLSDNVELGGSFFTSTSRAQEATLNQPFGITVVEGVAGSGKTSVALGRLKFFSNFASGEYLADYNLVNRPLSDFAVSGMVGYVRTHSLKHYLQGAAETLDMPHLRVKDFGELIAQLNTQLDLQSSFKLAGNKPQPLRTRMSWLKALDVAAARFLGGKMMVTLDSAKVQPSLAGRARIEEIAAGLLSSDVTASGFALDRLFSKLHGLYVTVGARDADTASVLKKIMNSVSVTGVFGAAVVSAAFSESATKALTLDGFTPEEIESSIREIQEAMGDVDENGKKTLSNADLVCLHSLSALMSEGSGDTGMVKSGKLYDIRQHKAVFIDEFQDFSEVELFLMSMSASRDYDQVTLAGDTYQMLQEKMVPSFKAMFPSGHRKTNADVFLPDNYRQNGLLGRLSAAYRVLVQGDKRIDVPQTGDLETMPLHVWADETTVVDLLVNCILQMQTGLTVAIICPTDEHAKRWFRLMEPQLTENFRSAILSGKVDLTKRNYVHFTHSYDTKGLEFDAVLVPDLTEFRLGIQSGINDLYVAISRARTALFLGTQSKALDNHKVSDLVAAGYLRLVELDNEDEFVLSGDVLAD